MSTPGPGLRRRQLGTALEQLRRQAGKSQAEAADVLDCARSQISQFESGTRVPRKPDLPALLGLYNAPAGMLDELEEIRLQANQRGWWSAHHLPEWVNNYLGLETDATAIRCFALELVPGQLQTAHYARDTYLRHGVDEQEVARYVAVRMERQRRIGVDQSLTVVASEALLHRTSAMGEVGAVQLRYLVAASELAGVEIRVLPFAAGGHVSMAGSFTMLEFPDQIIDPVAYQEYTGGGHLVDDCSAVDRLQLLYSQLVEQALSRDESAALIQEWAGRAE